MITCDLLVIGGGINGVGVARDAAGRGLSVVLCEKDDLANHTSSSSSKLIHGGLRYLEQIEFRLVRAALRERTILLRNASHLVKPLSFVLPYDTHLRPAWEIWLGLWLYNHLTNTPLLRLRGSSRFLLRKTAAGDPLQEKFTAGFRYTDCQTDDARLVIAAAQDASAKGAQIFTRTLCQAAHRENGNWVATLVNPTQQKKYLVQAKAIVNAAGPWVSDVLNRITQSAQSPSVAPIRLIKGSHIVIPKLYQGEHAYILQNKDQRVVFAIPYQHDFTLIGTTDVPFNGDPNQVEISTEEIQYLCNTVNYYFARQIKQNNVYWHYAGVRALYDSHAAKPQKITREYHLSLEDAGGTAPVLSIFGGKITTHRALAEQVLQKLKPYFKQMGDSWTEYAVLPGSENSVTPDDYLFLPQALIQRLINCYGCCVHQLLSGVQSLADLGRRLGGIDRGGNCLYEKEVQYLLSQEWALTAEDILWRRTKLGLFFSAEETRQLELMLC